MLALLIMAPFLLYCGAIGLGLLYIDDGDYYLANPLLHNGAMAGLRDLWTAPFFNDYFPVTQLTMWLDLAIGHGESFVFARFQQLAWLGLGTLAVVQVVFRISGRAGLSYAVGALYCLHPVTAESVLWLAERKNLVGFAFAWWCFFHHIAWRQDRRARSGWFSVVFCVLALLAKVHAVMIPAVLAAFEAFYGTTTWRNRILAVLPCAVLTLVFVFFSIHAVRPDLAFSGPVHSVTGSVFCDGAILLRYLVHAYVPQHLAMFYQAIEDPRRWVVLSACWIAVAALVATSGFIARDRRLIMFAWTATAMALLPALNLSNQAQTMSDHYLQWGLPFLLLIPCQLVSEMLHRVKPLEQDVPARYGLVGYALFLSLISWARISEFSSYRNAMTVGIRHEPQCGVNWAGYCYILTAGNHPSADAMEEGGRAGLTALRCIDRNHIQAQPYVSSLIYGTWECQKTEGSQAADALLAQDLPQVAPVALYIKGMIDVLEKNSVQAQLVLEQDYPPELRAAAGMLATACRDGHHQPWEATPCMDLASSQGGNERLRVIMQYRLQGLAMLATCYQLNGDVESSFALSALLVNISPYNPAAMLCYREACRRLGLEESIRRIDAERLDQSHSAVSASGAAPR